MEGEEGRGKKGQLGEQGREEREVEIDGKKGEGSETVLRKG